MNTNNQYYMMAPINDPAIPLIKQEEGSPLYLHKKEPVENPDLLRFVLQDPIPKKPKFVDYHRSPEPVVSEKVYDILAKMNISSIQLLPCEINYKGLTHSNYYAIHIWKRIKCVDPHRSDCQIKRFRLARVKKLVLDDDILESIPLSDRLVFSLAEDSGYQLFHQSIVDEISSIDPMGLRFVRIEEWKTSVFFQ